MTLLLSHVGGPPPASSDVHVGPVGRRRSSWSLNSWSGAGRLGLLPAGGSSSWPFLVSAYGDCSGLEGQVGPACLRCYGITHIKHPDWIIEEGVMDSPIYNTREADQGTHPRTVQTPEYLNPKRSPQRRPRVLVCVALAASGVRRVPPLWPP